MKKYIIVSEKPWHKVLFKRLEKKFSNSKWLLINNKKKFSSRLLQEELPDKVFVPHWSYIIPEDIHSNFECIVFHMTDLPFGRGGSPLQNLIVNGHSETKISAIRVENGLDTGPVYLKKPLCLSGTAQEIFFRSTKIIEEMISEIMEKDLKPLPQKGRVVEFKRRKPEESNIKNLEETEKFYDHIRMLDGEGYPAAFLETEYFRLEFSRASLKSEREIQADVRIIKK